MVRRSLRQIFHVGVVAMKKSDKVIEVHMSNEEALRDILLDLLLLVDDLYVVTGHSSHMVRARIRQVKENICKVFGVFENE
ncbi:MAG: hypothetical protein QXO75_03450 [Nitrososphaerota archaeon]